MRVRKRKLITLTKKEYEKDRTGAQRLLTTDYPGYDSCWVKVYDEDKCVHSFGHLHGAPAEITFDELTNNRKAVLEFIFDHQEVDVMDENGKRLFTITW